MSLPVINDFHDLFLSDIELLDVRAPIEFEQGAFPHSSNIPILNDDERHQVGHCYKTKGQDKAVELGHQLVSGDIKSTRIEAWSNFMQQRPNSALYCFRGGMRSKLTQQWLFEETGIAFPRVEGGYKALRQFLLEQLDIASKTMKLTILSGRTGSAKTRLLNKLEHKIDLEGVYHHRGSVFGRHVDAQPSQIDIENTLAIQLLKFQHQNIMHLIFEDESACIGARRIPDNLFLAMKQAPIVLLEVPIEERIDVIFDEYVTQALQEHVDYYDEVQGYSEWSSYLITAMDKIQRRLGGQAHKEIKSLLVSAIETGAPDSKQRDKSEARHKAWIERLLVDYYDPMYDYQLSKKGDRVIFKGNTEDVKAYLLDLHHC